MTFDEILEQVIILLKRQGRVSYPALKIRFSLDDDYLEALKAEILYVHPVVDDEGKGLIGTGEAETKPASTSTQPAQPEITPQPTTQEAQPTTEPPSTDPRPREAERRQPTVMFCDLVDSTKLSSQLDPEDYREVVREYQRVCSEVIQRYDGHIAQYLGDGLLVYFGYPQSHEDEAQRAVYTGLGILNVLRQLNARLEPTKGIRLALRIGIHTGFVVVGDIGAGSRQEQLALGETPNVAARIQGLAEPDTVVISASTYRLVQGYFDCQELGERMLRGVSQSVSIYQVLQESGVQSRLDIASSRGLTPLVGREQEVGLLIERWEQAKFQPAWHHRSYLTEITVNRLSRNQIEQMATRVAGGKNLPGDVLQQLVDKTDGVPLYVEEMTKALLESGHLKEVNEHYELTGTLPGLAIPVTLQDSLMARLDRLMTAKVIAQLGATIGRQFGFELLQAVAQLDEPTLQRELERLVEAELLYQRGLPPHATYIFKHALIQDTAHESLLHSTRQGYHRRIAEVLEERFPETAETQPELLAHHFTEAGLTEQSVPYWYKAGQRASERSAHVEAISHLRTGLELLQILPETSERTQREVDMLMVLGTSLFAIKGYGASEVEQTYTRARQLCQALDEPHQLFPVLGGLWGYALVHGELQTAHALGEQLVTLAQHTQDPIMLLVAHHAMGSTLSQLGVLTAAHTHLAQGIALDNAKHHRASVLLYGEDAGVVCRCHAVDTLWLLGYPDQALARSQEAVMLAQQMAHPLSLAYALGMAALFHQFRREVRAVQEHAEATISLAMEQGFPFWRAIGSTLHGWALAQQGQAQEGIAQITQGLRAFQATGAEITRWYYLALLAEAHSLIGQPEVGLTALGEALTLVDTTGARLYEAELHRLKGELLLQQSSENDTEAETCFHQAITITQNQSAKSWELRAATGLAKLWQSQGKRQEAYDLLAPVYNWFTEGFDTADLKDAKALLDALA